MTELSPSPESITPLTDSQRQAFVNRVGSILKIARILPTNKGPRAQFIVRQIAIAIPALEDNPVELSYNVFLSDNSIAEVDRQCEHYSVIPEQAAAYKDVLLSSHLLEETKYDPQKLAELSKLYGDTHAAGKDVFPQTDFDYVMGLLDDCHERASS